jgi:hypothetical protein
MHWTDSAIDSLHNIWVPHRNYEIAKADLFAAAFAAAPGEVIRLQGPTRVGKSSLVEKLSPMLTGKLTHGDNTMPVVTVNAENSSTDGAFSSKAFTLALLQAVRHPMFSMERPDLLDIKRLRLIERTSEGVLRTAVEQALRFRQTHYVVIDEAQHVAHTRGGAVNAAKFLDSLKCLAASTRTRLVLVGTYQLLPILQRSPHLIGRTLSINFPRYREDMREDLVAFDQILAAYSKHFMFQGDTTLRAWNEYLYRGSLGCMGLLRAWIRDALCCVQTLKDPHLRLRHFERSRRSDADLESIATEIRDGEKLCAGAASADRPEDREVQRTLITGKPKATRPFRSKPRRNPVGMAKKVRG